MHVGENRHSCQSTCLWASWPMNYHTSSRPSLTRLISGIVLENKQLTRSFLFEILSGFTDPTHTLLLHFTFTHIQGPLEGEGGILQLLVNYTLYDSIGMSPCGDRPMPSLVGRPQAIGTQPWSRGRHVSHNQTPRHRHIQTHTRLCKEHTILYNSV